MAVVRDRGVAQANSCWTCIVKTRVRSQACTFGICGVKTCTGTGFFPRTSRFPCQYHSTIAPYSFIHLPPTMYNVFLPALQFSPVYHSTIVPYHSHVSECEVTSAPPCTIILTKLLAQHKINSSGQQQCSWNVTLHGSCT